MAPVRCSHLFAVRAAPIVSVPFPFLRGRAMLPAGARIRSRPTTVSRGPQTIPGETRGRHLVQGTSTDAARRVLLAGTARARCSKGRTECRITGAA